MDAYSCLIEHKIKPSQQRIVLMDYLMKNPTHPTAEEIYSKLSPQMPTLSRTTVYNTLKLFVQKGVAQLLTIDERNSCFDADMKPHAHFFCKQCSHIYDIPIDPESLASRPKELERSEIQEVQLYYRGICPTCLKSPRKQEEQED